MQQTYLLSTIAIAIYIAIAYQCSPPSFPKIYFFFGSLNSHNPLPLFFFLMRTEEKKNNAGERKKKTRKSGRMEEERKNRTQLLRSITTFSLSFPFSSPSCNFPVFIFTTRRSIRSSWVFSHFFFVLFYSPRSTTSSYQDP